MAWRIAGLGSVTVSLRRSMVFIRRCSFLWVWLSSYRIHQNPIGGAPLLWAAGHLHIRQPHKIIPIIALLVAPVDQLLKPLRPNSAQLLELAPVDWHQPEHLDKCVPPVDLAPRVALQEALIIEV